MERGSGRDRLQYKQPKSNRRDGESAYIDVARISVRSPVVFFVHSWNSYTHTRTQSNHYTTTKSAQYKRDYFQHDFCITAKWWFYYFHLSYRLLLSTYTRHPQQQNAHKWIARTFCSSLLLCDPIVCVLFHRIQTHAHTTYMHTAYISLHIVSISRKHQFSVRWRNKCRSKALSLPAFSIYTTIIQQWKQNKKV